VERTRVAAIFEPGGKVKPQWFSLDGQQVRVLEVTYRWEHYEGAARIEHFSVTTDTAGLCELQFDTKDMSWTVQHGSDNILPTRKA